MDVVIKSLIYENMLVGVEAKISGFQNVLTQCFRCCLIFPYMYILYPKLPSKKSLEKLKKYSSSPGLIIPRDESLKEFYIYAKPRTDYFKYYNHRQSKKIWRNWNENRCGRKMHDRELPEGYDLEKAKALEDDYTWSQRYKREEREKKKIKKLKSIKTLYYFIK